MIHILDLRLKCILGVHPQEREKEQEISIDLSFDFDLPANDSISETIDYEKVATTLREFSSQSQFYLIETFATRALDLLFEKFPLIFAKIRVTKWGAIEGAKAVSIDVERWG